MKRSISAACFILVLCLLPIRLSGQPGSYTRYLDHPWVDSMLTTLSTEEKLAQSRWVLCSPDDGLQEYMEIARSVREQSLGGLIFTAVPDTRMRELAAYCLSAAELKPVIALEGSWDGIYPGMVSLAAIYSDSLRSLAGTKLAEQYRSADVSLLISGAVDETVASGMQDGWVQVIDPDQPSGLYAGLSRIPAARIREMGDGMEEVSQADTTEQRARQVLALKYWIGQGNAESALSMQKGSHNDKDGQLAFIRELYARSLTVLSNREQLIPVRELERTKIACLAVNQEHETEFQAMAGRYTQTDNYFWNPGCEEKDELAERLAAYDLVLAALYPGSYGEETQDLLTLLKQQTKLAVVWFGDPAAMAACTSITADGSTAGPEGLILAYEQDPFTERLAAQLIFGGIGGSGRLPAGISDQYAAGSGIHTPGGLRLQYGFPEDAGLCSARLNRAIDSIVNRGLEAGAYPGCQVIVARKGTVVFHKAYGHHSYEDRVEVREHDLYDLASVTKISGPLSGLMLLEGMEKFSYRDRLGDYCDAMKGSDKAGLALKDVLAHRAGLFPWIPYHERTIKKNGKYKKRFIRQDEDDKYSVQVADRLYLSNTFKEKIFKEIRKSELGDQEYRYSGLSFFLFPTIIEELSGQPYESFLAEQIYHRLGAWELLYHPRSSYPGSRIVPTEYDSLFRKQLVHGYVHDEGAALMGSHAGNAGLFASANDLLKLIEMYRRMGSYGGEQIISEEVLREYSSYQFPELENRRGLGFDKPLLNESDGTPDDYPCPGASRSSFGHSGFTGTFVWADPEHEISYVFLCNRVHTTRTNQLLYQMNIRTNILQSVYDSILEP